MFAGIYDLRVWPFCEANDGNGSVIPGKFCQHGAQSGKSGGNDSGDDDVANKQMFGQTEQDYNNEADNDSKESASDLMERKKNKTAKEMRRLAKLSKNHRNGLMPSADWLDRLAFR